MTLILVRLVDNANIFKFSLSAVPVAALKYTNHIYEPRGYLAHFFGVAKYAIMRSN